MKNIFALLAVILVITASIINIKADEKGLPRIWDGHWKGMTTLAWASGKTEAVETKIEIISIPGGNSKQWKIN